MGSGYLLFALVKFIGYSIFAGYIRRQFPHQSTADRSIELDNDRCIADDRSCQSCGYNLHGLKPEGRCPECATPVVASLEVKPQDAFFHPISDAVLVGAARTAIGIAVGSCYWYVGKLTPDQGIWYVGLVAGLVPVRVGEWWLTIYLFFDRPLAHRSRGWRVVSKGVLVSFLLDIPAWLGFCVASRAFIC